MSRLPVNAGWFTVDEAVITKVMKVCKEQHVQAVLQEAIDKTLAIMMSQQVFGGLMPVSGHHIPHLELFHDHVQLWLTWMQVAIGTGCANASLQRPATSVKMRTHRNGAGPHSVYCITVTDAIAYCGGKPRAASFLPDLQGAAAWWEAHKAEYVRL